MMKNQIKRIDLQIEVGCNFLLHIYVSDWDGLFKK